MGIVPPVTPNPGPQTQKCEYCQDYQTMIGRNDGYCQVNLPDPVPNVSPGPCGAPNQRVCASAPPAPSEDYDLLCMKGLEHRTMINPNWGVPWPMCQLQPPRCHDLSPPAVDAPLDVTFYVATDVHHGAPYISTASHAKHVRVMNRFATSGARWPEGFAGAGQVVAAPAFVVLTGDLTQYGHFSELGYLRLLYEPHTDGSLHYTTFPGLGNHDTYGNCHENNCAIQMFQYVNEQMGQPCYRRTGVSIDPASANYSWNWGKLHLIQMNKWPGDTQYGVDHTHASGFGWFEADLRRAAGRPVVLFQHYGIDAAESIGKGWWSDDNRTALYQAMTGAEVLGAFVGHSHEPSCLEFGDPVPSKTNPAPPCAAQGVSSSGRGYPFFQGGTGGQGRNSATPEHPTGTFLVAHITDDAIDVAWLYWNDSTESAIFDPRFHYTASLSSGRDGR